MSVRSSMTSSGCPLINAADARAELARISYDDEDAVERAQDARSLARPADAATAARADADVDPEHSPQE